MTKKRHFSRTIIGILIIAVFVSGVISLYYFTHKSTPKSEGTVFSQADGTIWQVVKYIKKDLVKNPESFRAIHWSKLTKSMDLSGDTVYTVGLVYQIQNNEGRTLMLSKRFELDQRGFILFEIDVEPFINLNRIQ